jgi:hypothetical protein
MNEFLMKTSGESLELLNAIADEMVTLFSISRTEAVARINQQWRGTDLSGEDEIILHEDERYWALSIYYGGSVPDWSPSADRSAWSPQPVPPRGSGLWPNELSIPEGESARAQTARGRVGAGLLHRGGPVASCRGGLRGDGRPKGETHGCFI